MYGHVRCHDGAKHHSNSWWSCQCVYRKKEKLIFRWTGILMIPAPTLKTKKHIWQKTQASISVSLSLSVITPYSQSHQVDSLQGLSKDRSGWECWEGGDMHGYFLELLRLGLKVRCRGMLNSNLIRKFSTLRETWMKLRFIEDARGKQIRQKLQA